MGEKKGLALIYEGIAAFALPQGMLFMAQNEKTGSGCLKILRYKKNGSDCFDGNKTIPSFDRTSVTSG